ncbi:MAG: histidine kinase, partial [Bacteroidetes bacterium]|nr:histidine kinase [Bacteroidota bacterium]
NFYETLFTLPDGTMILAALEGFIRWNIYSFPINNQKPIVYFSRFVAGGKEVAVENNSIHLPSSAKDLSVDFSAIVTVMGDRTKFFYKILPQQKEWISTAQRTISLASITSGKFTLFIKAINSDGTESEEKQITISVAYPFWKTGWFKLLCLLLIAGLAYAIAKWRITIIRREEKNNAFFKSQMAEMEMKALRSQMNPHFIFNCINSIDGLIQSNDRYNATVYLNKFAKLLRNILDTSKQNTVLFSKDAETLKLYIELEELRHENKFKTKYIVDTELLNSDYKVPPLIVQPYVENAIMHGLRNKAENEGILTIDIKKVNDKIQYIITDNGIGREAAGKIMQNKESHYGMEMSHDRIKLFNKEEEASVQIKDLYSNNIPAGTEVTVNLNYI